MSSESNYIPYPMPANPKFTFIDLFAGIGGFRIALQNLGGKCVFSSEWDKYAEMTYLKNFGDSPFGNIKEITDPKLTLDRELDKLIPSHDLLTAGFPCQPFSLAGVSKKNSLGRKHGFYDLTQGTLFFDIKRILKVKRPKVFFLENVKYLLTHDRGRTFRIIRESLERDLGYVVRFKDIVVDGVNWVPQHRERVFIIGYNPEKIDISDKEIIIPKEPSRNYKYPKLKHILAKKVENKYTIGLGTWTTLKRHKKHHESEGNGFGYSLIRRPVGENTVTRTISARYPKDGAEILIAQKGKRPRRLTVKEAMRLQGFDPDRFIFPVSNTQAYRLIGNSVVIPAVETIAREIVKVICDEKRKV